MAHLDQCLLDELAQQCLAVAQRLDLAAPDAETALLGEWRKKEAVRLRIEGLTEDGAPCGARRLTEGGIGGYVGSTVEALSGSNLWRIAAAPKTDIGNDYAAFLQYAMWVPGRYLPGYCPDRCSWSARRQRERSATYDLASAYRAWRRVLGRSQTIDCPPSITVVVPVM